MAISTSNRIRLLITRKVRFVKMGSFTTGKPGLEAVGHLITSAVHTAAVNGSAVDATAVGGSAIGSPPPKGATRKIHSEKGGQPPKTFLGNTKKSHGVTKWSG